MVPARATQTRQTKIIEEERVKVQKSLTRLDNMLDDCDNETAAGLEQLRSATQEQLDELEQQLEQLHQT